jgi:hypothetical protein
LFRSKKNLKILKTQRIFGFWKTFRFWKTRKENVKQTSVKQRKEGRGTC